MPMVRNYSRHHQTLLPVQEINFKVCAPLISINRNHLSLRWATKTRQAQQTTDWKLDNCM